MSKISVTTIAGLTAGADANLVKIESGDSLQVVNGNFTVSNGASIFGGTGTFSGHVLPNADDDKYLGSLFSKLIIE